MKGMIYQEYGSLDNLQLGEIEMPAVQDDSVLVEIQAASVNWHDWHFLTGKPFMVRLMAGLLKPKNQVLGSDFSGRVEAVGANIKRFHPGDEVFGSTSHGCFAEYVVVSEDELEHKPTCTTFEEASTVGAAAFTALQGLRDKAQIKPEQRILIYGASGGVGTFAVQIAKFFKAEVTGVCSTGNLDMVRSIGAYQVIDYTRKDFTQNEQRYDLIFDVVAKLSFSDCQRVLRPKGVYLTTKFSPTFALRAQWISGLGSQKMVPLLARPPEKRDLAFMKQLLEDGKVTPIIDRCYSLREVPDALQYLGKGHARGKIVIVI